VVTNLVICKKRTLSINDDEITNFVIVKTELNEEIDIEDIAIDINSINIQSKNVVIKQYSKKAISEITNLGLSYNSCFGNLNWLVKNISKFEKSNKYLQISRGERRGWDKLFYPNSATVDIIEDEYLRPVLKTSKGKFQYIVEPDNFAFCCDVSLDVLEKNKHIGALNWIKQFENGVNEKGQPLVKVLERKNLYWYQMADNTLADFVLSVNPDTKIFIQRFINPSFTNQRLINISVNDESIDKELIHALLNSTIIISQIESLGFGRGESVLDINPTNLRNGLYIPKIESISNVYKENIIKYFNDIMKEPVMSVTEILTSKIRRDFDKLIFESLNIDFIYLKDVYENLELLYDIRKSSR
jgi:predicted metal-binding transcription factor (methanogenesis marker protein 9)